MILLQDSSEVRVGLETLDSAFLATITNPVVLGAAVLTMTGRVEKKRCQYLS